MARILISCFSPLEENGSPAFLCMYEGFFRALEAEGNRVMVINSAFLVECGWNGTNKLLPHIDEETLAAAVIAFAPELTFAFNHSIPAPVLEILNCPIVLWDADLPQFYNDKDVIKQNIDRYHFFCFSRYGIENAIAFGAPGNRVFFVPSGTAVQAKPIVQDKAISFIGTMFQNPPGLRNFMLDYPDRLERDRIVALVCGGYGNINDPYIVERRDAIEAFVQLGQLFSMYAPQRRIEIVNAVADLGLTLYGGDDWTGLAQFFPDIAASYNRQRVYSLQHNQDVYNSSKICLNISHTQVVDGYAWRVLDVLASNGCLLSDRQKGIAELLKGYIDLPMFETAGQGRDLAQRLLRDEPHRRAIIEASQRCIEDKGRWKHRFAEIESILPLKLTRASLGEATGSVTLLDKSIYHPAQTRAYRNRLRNQRYSKTALLKHQVKQAMLLTLPPIVTQFIGRRSGR